MPTLAEKINTPEKRNVVVQDLARFVDQEVGRKSGLSGLGIKTAYGLVKEIKPSFVPEVIDGMFDDWVRDLEPVYAKVSAESGGTVASRFASRASEVADALLAVTDRRAATTTHGSVKKTYEKLRPTAKRNVEEAVPRLGELLERHTK
jgi:hypothetical protein